VRTPAHYLTADAATDASNESMSVVGCEPSRPLGQAVLSPDPKTSNPLQTQPLTNPTESVLPVCLPDSALIDPDLALIVTSWEQLPAAVKTGMIAMVRAVEGRWVVRG